LLALRAPLIAAAAVLTNLLATAAAFGAAKLIFQDGGLESLLGFESQGFLDAWGPVFFFAMVFAISMDYTVFLLASAKELWDATHDPRAAVVGGLERSGRVIFAAGAVMVAVFFTFALSGPLPPKEMGVILGIAVLLDAAVVRLLLLPVLLRLMGRWAWSSPHQRLAQLGGPERLGGLTGDSFEQSADPAGAREGAPRGAAELERQHLGRPAGGGAAARDGQPLALADLEVEAERLGRRQGELPGQRSAAHRGRP
jgi:hypothetical protein